MLANLIYILALFAASPVVLYRAVRFGRYRRGISEKLFGLSKQRADELCGKHGCVWLHAVSVGEVNLLSGIVEGLQASAPETAIAISTSTDTGYDLAIKKFGSHRVFFCPLDFTWAVRRTLENLRPNKLILAELELWPNLIRLSAERGCPTFVFNARLSEKSAKGYAKFAALTRSTFARLNWVGCQDATTAKRFIDCGTLADRVHVTGSLKFDGAPDSRDTLEIQERVQWAGRDPWHRVWLFGSTQAGEEQLAIDVYQRLRSSHHELRLILVPRHPERFDAVSLLIESAGLSVHRRSTGHSLEHSAWENDTVILVDSIGELKHWWGVSHIATVGGSFGDRGGQNMLEPAGYGCATSFGPNTRNFAQIADNLLRVGGAVRVADVNELETFVAKCLDDIPAADALGRNARSVVAANRGATETTIAALVGTAGRQRAAA
tara:strand:- start:489346 stop:490653 length:1308 start_codon:yes stop_codon:yes gene_type:complete